MATLTPDRDAVSTLVSVIGDSDGNTSLSARKQKQASDRAHALYDTMAKLAEPNGIELRRPTYSGDAIQFSQQIVEQMTDDKVGRWKSLPDGRVSYHWYETEKQFGILSHGFKRVKHTHEIIRPRFHKLPYRGVMPKKPKRIHDSIIAVPALRKAARVLTGTLTGQDAISTANWEEDTLLTKAAKSVASGAKNGAQSVAAAVSDVASAVGSAGRAAGVAISNSFPGQAISEGASRLSRAYAADPCLIIGELVLVGWVEDEQ